MNTKLHCGTLLLFTTIVQTYAILVMEGDPVTITCPLTGSYRYPVWTGPASLSNPLTSGSTFNEDDMQWADSDVNRHIRLTEAMLKHDGTYTCQDSTGRRASVKLDVGYYKMPSIDIETSSSGRTVLTCGAYSNPALQIPVKLATAANIDNPQPGAKITYNGCDPDADMDNRMYCSVTAVWYMWKGDNGKEQSCTFVVNNVTKNILAKRAYFNFPPTIVRISGNKPVTKGPTLPLTCSTDSSYPVSTLVWRKGTGSAQTNPIITNNARSTVRDDKYNGKNVSQILSLKVTNDMSGERISCCASNVCASVTLSINITSDGSTVTMWMVLMVACIILTNLIKH
ncbi:uncharacterized protein LOC132714919 [Ruditapes philippinarum]|uniref:uncharacterized protein LOC132714919 n=1 Tax=Ruditapes philippinarum TaxID=129788 RepID=UPI00295AE88B|nr:uncharacterized protein LOC132714919 [Ruditapes philippinarum]